MHFTRHYTILHYTHTIHYTTLITLHYTTLQLQLQLYHTTTPTTVPYTTLHYTALITPHHRYNCKCNYTTLRNYTTLQLQLHYTTTTTTATTTTGLHHTTSSSCGGVTTATMATTPKSRAQTRTSFRTINGFALLSMHHNNSPLL